jgi:hypothetical protein
MASLSGNQSSADRSPKFLINASKEGSWDPRRMAKTARRPDGETARRQDGDFIKACAETRDELDQWARQIAGGDLHPCGLCRPE